ncbi:MAG: Long-chain-fatty-acid--CoA ligase FadD15 [Firmicutes bacterium ADurb.Bin419]|nr:MAG: Long-chain-fatty-acid--CoA ligase FadD15 [Firmicutes bacterium ADurb.Bin419]
MVKLSEIKNYLKNNSSNYIEYFEKGRRCTKKYCEVHDDVMKVVSFIRSKGIEQRDRIGIIGSNTYEWLLVDLACVVGGWISVSFHERNFENEIDKLEADHNLKLLFLDEKYLTKAEGTNCVSLNSIKEVIQNHDMATGESASFLDEEIFTVIFTSGTTGFPKALSIKVVGVDSFINETNKLLKFKDDDKIIIFLPMSVFTCKAYIYGAISLGFNIVLANIDNFTIALKKSQPTIMQGVPYLFETIHDTFYNVIKDSKIKLLFVKLFFLLCDKELIPEAIKSKIQAAFFKDFINFWGGKMRLMLTGSAPISAKVLRFYRNMGVNLYEAYATNEAGLICINYPGKTRIGSVGTPFSNRKIKISPEGEILVEDGLFAFKYESESDEFNSKIFRDDGYIATGDMGHFDKDGFLYIEGRIKDVITLGNGEKVLPGFLENMLKESPYIKQAMVYGDNKPFLSCIITRMNDSVTEEMIRKEIDSINLKVTEVNRIKEFVFTKEPFSIDNGQLNSNLKMNRSVISKAYENELNKIYV